MKIKLFGKDLTTLYTLASFDRYILRKLFVLYYIATLKEPTMSDIEEAAQISRPALSRILRELREQDEINIVFKRRFSNKEERVPRGNYGYYVIESWGPLDQKQFLDTFLDQAKSIKNP